MRNFLPSFPARISDHYGVLEVKRTASSAVIRWAWRRRPVKLSHSQALAHPDAAERMQRANEAAEVLLDPVRRAEHDRRLAESEKGRSGRSVVGLAG